MAATLPNDLLVFYAWPSTINGVASNALAAAEFANYDIVVLGDGLADSSHPDYANTQAILNDAAVSAVDFYGYIDCGQLSGNSATVASVTAEVAQWKALSTQIKGVLLDEFGYDYGLTRTFQNQCIDAVHAQTLKVIANAFQPADALSNDIVQLNSVNGGNPTGAASNLAGTDYWLAESFIVRADGSTELGGTDPNFDGFSVWKTRMDSFWEEYNDTPVNLLTLTTIPSTATTFTQAHFDMAWYGSTMYQANAMGWGEIFFSASNSLAPLRTRPTPSATIGNWVQATLDGDANDQLHVNTADTSDTVYRLADNGYVEIDFSTRTGDFVT